VEGRHAPVWAVDGTFDRGEPEAQCPESRTAAAPARGVRAMSLAWLDSVVTS